MRVLYLLILVSNLCHARIDRFAHYKNSHKHKEIHGRLLTLNGIAVHRRFIFDVYQLALYVRKPTKKADEIIQATDYKYAQMTFLRDIEAGDLREAFAETFKENCLDKCSLLENDIQKLLLAIPDIKEGDNVDFLFTPEHSVISGFGETAMTFSGPEFGHFFIRAWLGATPPSERFKRELLNI